MKKVILVVIGVTIILMTISAFVVLAGDAHPTSEALCNGAPHEPEPSYLQPEPCP